ncbi:carbohydrate binding domain-containing protein [candidate division KSB1 bacterium]|nr:carbohydrate binding domain-containing protein [candidate division KSB1 bacterium]
MRHKKSILLIIVWMLILTSFTGIHATIRTINGVAVPSDFPDIQTTVLGETAPGRIFMSSTFFDSGSRSNYLIICENDGTPYFYRKYTRDYLGCGDFKVQPNGLLSFHKYIHGEDGLWIVMDQNFVEIDTFTQVGRDRTDSHEFVMLPNGHALLNCDHDSTIDMSQIVTGGNTNARVISMDPQEVDSEGNLYWEWKSLDHLDIADSYANLRQASIDYTHLNSIAVDYDGHYIFSLNRFNEVCKVNSTTGDIIWRLGGRNNEFTFITESTMIASQHHARPVPGQPNHYTIYDNAGGGNSRGVEYSLNVGARTAEKVWEYYDNQQNGMMGSVQRLDNGNTYIDWSDNPPLRAVEVDASNNKVFEIQVNGISSYRSYRFDWDGMMLKPYLLAESKPEAVELIFNKFGDTDVKEYEVVGGKTPGATEILYTTSNTWAELTDLDNSSRYYLKVCAVNHSDQRSDYSDMVTVDVQYSIPGVNLIVNGDFSSGTSGWEIVNQSTGQGSGSISNGEYKVQITNSGTDYYHVQLVQESFPLIEGRTYALEFDAYADASRIIEPRVAQNGGNYTNYSKTSAIYITPQKQNFSYEFVMTDPSDDQARLVLNCGSSNIDCYFDNVSVAEFVESDVAIRKSEQPNQFELSRNYPNPFNGSTAVKFYVPESSHVKATVFDITGKQVAEIANSPHEAGLHTLRFNSSDLSSGVYFCRINATTLSGSNSFEQSQKWILLK